MTLTKLAMALAALAVGASAATAQVSSLPAAKLFPNENAELVTLHLNKARELAGDDLYQLYQQRCIIDQAFPIIDDLMQDPGLIIPTKAFEDLYFVGQNGVSAWLVKTNAGYVVFDALNNADEAENILAAGMRQLGLNPAELRYVVVTHEHRDHYGGAKYLQDTYGAQVVASEVAWTSMERATGTPVRNVTVADGQSWTVGGKTFQFFVTPGHTDGALSTLIPVTDKGGKKHVAALYGGFGIPGSVANKVKQIQSLQRFGVYTQAAGVDVIIGNHQVQDASLAKMDLARHRRCEANTCTDPNPFVIEKPVAGAKSTSPEKFKVYTRFLGMQEQCIRVNAARNGQTLPF
jgi:metallo-beta-lactamase class B